MVLVWPGIVQSWSNAQNSCSSKERRQVQSSSSGEVDFSSLLVVIVVVVGSHLLQELAHHLGGLGAESESVSKGVKTSQHQKIFKKLLTFSPRATQRHS